MAWAPRFEARLSEAGSCDIKELRSLMQKNGYVVLRKWLTEETRADIRSAMMALQDEVCAGSKNGGSRGGGGGERGRERGRERGGEREKRKLKKRHLAFDFLLLFR